MDLMSLGIKHPVNYILYNINDTINKFINLIKVI